MIRRNAKSAPVSGRRGDVFGISRNMTNTGGSLSSGSRPETTSGEVPDQLEETVRGRPPDESTKPGGPLAANPKAAPRTLQIGRHRDQRPKPADAKASAPLGRSRRLIRLGNRQLKFKNSAVRLRPQPVAGPRHRTCMETTATPETQADRIRRLVAEAPRLTPSQADHIAHLLRGQ